MEVRCQEKKEKKKKTHELRDPRLEQEPTDMIAMASTQNMPALAVICGEKANPQPPLLSNRSQSSQGQRLSTTDYVQQYAGRREWDSSELPFVLQRRVPSAIMSLL